MKLQAIFLGAMMCIGFHSHAQTPVTDSIQIRTFIIRNSIYFDKLAFRFNILPKELKKYNKSVGEVLYKGKMVNVPIKVRPTQWDPSKFNSNKAFLGPEDARPQEEIEWDKEGVDVLLVEEVINLDELNADSIQFEKIENHINRIDKRLNFLTYANDSIKKTEFSFEYDEKDVNTILKRMAAARNRYYANTPLGLEMDSLKELRAKLDEESNRLRKNIGEYQYLVENAYYFEKTKNGLNDLKMYKAYYGEERLAFESNYASGKMIPILSAKDRNLLRAEKQKAAKKERADRKEATRKDASLIKEKRKKKVEKNKKKVEEEVLSTKPTNEKVVEDENPFVVPNENKVDDLAPKEIKENKAVENPITTEPIKSEITEVPVPVEKEPTKPQAKKAKKVIAATENEAKIKEEKEIENPVSEIANPADEKNEKSTEDNLTKKNEKAATTEIILPAATIENKESDVKPSEQEKIVSPSNPTPKENSPVVKKITKKEPSPKSATKEQKNPSPEIAVNEEDEILELPTKQLESIDAIPPAEQISALLYAKKIVKSEESKKDEVDKLFEEKQIKLPPYSVKPFKVEYVKGVPSYLIPKDSLSKQKSAAYINRFKSNILLDDQKTALKDLEKAIEIDPTNRKAWTYHADLLLSSDSQIDAMKEYQIAAEIDPKNSDVFYKVAKLYENSNNLQKSYEFYQKAVDADSFFIKAYYARALLSLKQDDKKAALDDYSTIINLFPNLPEAYKERGNLRLLERDYNGALADYNEYFSIANPNGEILYRRGVTKIYTGKIIEGCSDFSNAATLGYQEAIKALKKYCE